MMRHCWKKQREWQKRLHSRLFPPQEKSTIRRMVWRLLRNGERERVRKPVIHAGTVCGIISRVMNEAVGTAAALGSAGA